MDWYVWVVIGVLLWLAIITLVWVLCVLAKSADAQEHDQGSGHSECVALSYSPEQQSRD